VTVLDHYTSSFHWAEGNVSAIWLRGQWYLLTNSVISDVQNGGLTFVSGGDYTHSSVIPGYWALAQSSVFIGHTQPQDADHAFALDAGPFNDKTKPPLTCDPPPQPDRKPNYCASKAEGITMPLAKSFDTGQRLFNIYDGPAYEDSIAYLDITKTDCPDSAWAAPGCMYGKGIQGRRKEPGKAPDSCYLPNAAIGWKQPNGFFYPPAFHSRNLYFNNVDIRHYVINPLFREAPFSVASAKIVNGGENGVNGDKQIVTVDDPDNFLPVVGDDKAKAQLEVKIEGGKITNINRVANAGRYRTFSAVNAKVTGAGLTGALVFLTAIADSDEYFRPGGTYLTDTDLVEKQYCKPTDGLFNGFSSIDLQTELNDDDGSLTGLTNDVGTGTISVNQDQFFAAPADTPQCLSNIGISPPATCSRNPLPVYAQTQTARTSPYDYVYVAIAPKGLDEPYWSENCASERCYGVPLYRQYLTESEWAQWTKDPSCAADPTQAKCRWPFIRMSGMKINQRGTLTANHGKYYIDTSVSESTQKSQYFTASKEPPFVNVFRKGQTYNVFFVYAKSTLQQTYQIYVGKDFDCKMLRAVRAKIETAPVINFEDYKDDKGPAPQPSWLKFNSPLCHQNGILTVTIDFNDIKELKEELDPSPANLCRPSSFCKPNNGQCGCAVDMDKKLGSLTNRYPLINANPDIKNECENVCRTWAAKELDCPKKGCLGFSFTLSSSFEADGSGQKARPRPEAFPTTAVAGKPDWKTQFRRTDATPDGKPGSKCYYPVMPGPGCSQ
jgi:hypothetical protein